MMNKARYGNFNEEPYGQFDDGNFPGHSDIYPLKETINKNRGVTFKVDESLLIDGRKKEKINAFIDNQEKEIWVMKGEIKGSNKNAYVWKYIDESGNNIPTHLIGEELFNRNAILNLGIKNKLPTLEAIYKLRNNQHKEFIKRNFEKNGKMIFPGVYEPKDDEFDDIGARIDLWLQDGTSVGIDENTFDHNPIEIDQRDPEYGSSIMLLEDFIVV